MTRVLLPAPGAETMAPSSPASRPSPPGGLRPAVTPAPGGTGQHRSGAGSKEDQQSKIHLTEVSTVWGDCRLGSQVRAGERAITGVDTAGVGVGRGWGAGAGRRACHRGRTGRPRHPRLRPELAGAGALDEIKD